MTTRIALIADESGSMSSMGVEARNAIVNFIKEQQRVKDDDCRLTFIKFSDYYNVVFDAVPIGLIDANGITYTPSNSTALFDAVGRTLASLSRGASARTIVVILTDGQENASREYSLEAVKAAINLAQSKGWTILYLAQGMSGWAQGLNMGIQVSNSIRTTPGTKGQTQSAYATASATAANIRTGKWGVDKSGAVGADLQGAYDVETQKTTPNP